MYVYTSVCKYDVCIVCMYIYIYICMYACMYACKWECVHVLLYVYMLSAKSEHMLSNIKITISMHHWLTVEWAKLKHSLSRVQWKKVSDIETDFIKCLVNKIGTHCVSVQIQYRITCSQLFSKWYWCKFSQLYNNLN